MEILLPVFIMIAVSGIRFAVNKSDREAELHLDKAVDFLPTQSPPFGQYSPAVTGLPILGLQGLSSSVGYTFAFGPDNAVTRAMQTAFENEFPYFKQVRTLVFADEDALEDYCTDSRYAKYSDTPGIYGAVVLQKVGSANAGDRDWAYSLRFNATGSGRVKPAPGVPNTFRVKYKNGVFPLHRAQSCLLNCTSSY